jgi:DNA-binding transcriptional LysR family regulator
MAILAGIDLNLMVVLDALLAERSVTRAARRVGLSQSGLSHALARLRALTGDPLVVRTARELSPTPRARELHAPIRAALEQIEAVLRPPAALDPRKIDRALRIAAVDFAQMVVVPALLDRLRREAPGVDLVVTPYPEEVTRPLAAGELDLALGLSRRLPHLHQRELLRDRFVCLVRRGHPCLSRKMTPALFAELAHAIVTPRGLARGTVDRALKKRRLRRRVVLTVPHFLAAAAAVVGSDLVVTVARRVAESPLVADLPLVAFDPPVALEPIALTAAWHERHEGDAVHRWARERLAEIAREL